MYFNTNSVVSFKIDLKLLQIKILTQISKLTTADQDWRSVTSSHFFNKYSHIKSISGIKNFNINIYFDIFLLIKQRRLKN